MNRALLPALARQIRLRNLSGAILVDLAGLPARRRAALGPALAEALADDPARPRLLGFTALGLAEIVRPRVHPPLHELLPARMPPGWRRCGRWPPRRPPRSRPHAGIARRPRRGERAGAGPRRRLRTLRGGRGAALILRSDPSLPGAMDDGDADGWNRG